MSGYMSGVGDSVGVNDKLCGILLLKLRITCILSLLYMGNLRAFAKYWCMISANERKYVNTVITSMFQQFITLDTTMTQCYAWPTDGINYSTTQLISINGDIIESPCIWLFLFIKDKCNCSIYSIGLYKTYFIPWLLTIQYNIDTIRWLYMNYAKNMLKKINSRLCYFLHILSLFIDIQQPIINTLTKLQTELKGIIQGIIPPPKNMKKFDVMIHKIIEWDKLMMHTHYYTNVLFNYLITEALDELCDMIVNLKETLYLCPYNNDFNIKSARVFQDLSNIINLFDTIIETNPFTIKTLIEAIIDLYGNAHSIVNTAKNTYIALRIQTGQQSHSLTKPKITTLSTDSVGIGDCDGNGDGDGDGNGD